MYTRFLTMLGGIALILSAAAPPLAAQERLKDSDLRILIEVVEADIRDGEQWLQQRHGTYAGPRLWHVFERDAPRFEDRSLDPRAWIESNARRLPVPPGATYVPGCSRYVTRLKMAGLAREPLPPLGLPREAPVTAVFTFNMAAGGMMERLHDQARSGTLGSSEPPSLREGYVGREAGEVARRAGAFIMRNGFRTNADGTVSNNYSRDALKVALFSSSLYTGSYPMTLKQIRETEGARFEPDSEDARSCADLATGPALWFVLQALPGEMPESHRDAALVRLGLEGDVNTELFIASAVDWARRDLADPEESGLRQLERDAADPQYDDSVREQLAARKHNLDWYRRHAARLDPLFAELERQSYERAQAPTWPLMPATN